jgi:hypothetical protein
MTHESYLKKNNRKKYQEYRADGKLVSVSSFNLRASEAVFLGKGSLRESSHDVP